ncbi:MAG: energy transducer TonB [Fluviicola sp.]|nr:energy transducer TonB [Fluviicola sp.]
MKCIFLFIILFPFFVSSQDESLPPVLTAPVDTVLYFYDPEVAGEDSIVYLYPDKEAQFPGGILGLLKYFSDSLLRPIECGSICVVGRIYLKFIINKSGQVSNIEIERGIDKVLDKITKEMIENMPNWKPALHNGEKVRSFVRLPVNWE